MIEEDVLLFFQAEEEQTMEKNENFFDTNYTDRVDYFHKYVRRLHNDGLTYLEALVEFCNHVDCDEEKVAKYISPSLKQDIYEESVELNIIKPKESENATQLL